MTKANEGFIVHPNFTGNNKYQASYGNHNKTNKSFRTLAEAKDYLRSKKIFVALYDNPSKRDYILISEVKKKIQKKRKSNSNPFKVPSMNDLLRM